MGSSSEYFNIRYTYKMMLKYSPLAAISASLIEAQRFKSFDFHGENIKLRGRAFIIANPPTNADKFMPVTAAMINGGYWELLTHVYSAMNGILSSKKYDEDFICLGDGWLIHNFNVEDADPNLDWSEMPKFNRKYKFGQLCSGENCADDATGFRENLQFSKHPTECQNTHIWVTNEWFDRFDSILDDKEPENLKGDDEKVVETTDAPEPETTQAFEEWCGHGFMMDDETNECFEERDRAFLWAMKDRNTPMLYGWPSLVRDPNMLHDYYAYDRKITSPNNDYAFINTHCSLILHVHEWGVSDISTKWKSPNEGIPGYTCDLRLETSGKLVLSSMEDGSTIWESTVPESAKQMNNFWLVVDDDGVLRIYGSRDGVTPQKFRSAGSFEEIWSSDDEQSVGPTDAPEPETTPTSEEWCGHGFMMDDETNECFEERDRAFLWAMKDKNTPMLYGWPSLIRDPNMLHDYYAYDRKITSPNNDYAFI